MKKLIKICLVLFSFSCISSGENQWTEIDSTTFNEISSEENIVLVDARHNDYYNGWQNPIVQSNGHFKNAIDFSAKWLKVLADASDKHKEKISMRLRYEVDNKGIRQGNKVIVYSSDIAEAKAVADYLISQNIDASKVSIYSMTNPPKDALVTIKNYERLVSPKFIHDLVTTGQAESYTNTNYQLFEVSWGSSKGSYDKGHVDQSIHIDTGDFEHPPLWSLNDDQDLLKFAQKYGINKDATVILYGAEQMAAFRTAIILEYMGVKDVRVLNGGLQNYIDAGYELSDKSYQPNKGNYQPLDFSGRKLIDTYEDIKAKMSKDWQLVDGRTVEEHEGKTSGYDYLTHKGTIPNSIFHGAKFADNSGSVADYINVDNTMRNIEDINRMLTGAGIDVNKHMSFYCGTGWRVAEIIFYLQINGYPHSSIYSNSWAEYSDKNM